MIVTIFDGCFTATRFLGKGSELNNRFYEDPKKLDFYVDERLVDERMAKLNAMKKTGPEVIRMNMNPPMMYIVCCTVL